MRAILQKNGNVAVQHTGAFDRNYGPRETARVRHRIAKCLHGLKLIEAATLALYDGALEMQNKEMKIRELSDNAKELGFSITPIEGK